LGVTFLFWDVLIDESVVWLGYHLVNGPF